MLLISFVCHSAGKNVKKMGRREIATHWIFSFCAKVESAASSRGLLTCL